MCAAVAEKQDRQPKPPTRAYVLVQSADKRRDQVIDILRHQSGVVAVDPVEGPPDIVMVIEAPSRRKLASALTRAMESVQDLTDGLELLPTDIPKRSR